MSSAGRLAGSTRRYRTPCGGGSSDRTSDLGTARPRSRGSNGCGGVLVFEGCPILNCPRTHVDPGQLGSRKRQAPAGHHRRSTSQTETYTELDSCKFRQCTGNTLMQNFVWLQNCILRLSVCNKGYDSYLRIVYHLSLHMYL